MKPHVQLKEVSKYFYRSTGEQIIGLNRINLDIYAGEIVGVIGTNGAGKSTFLNCLAGLLNIDSGAIYINEERIDRLSFQQYASRVSHVFQDPRKGTAPRMTVFENLMLSAKRGESRRLSRSLTHDNRIQMFEFLADFKLDLENRLDVQMASLSGGQRQAVALLMATLKKPELLLLDEHTASLDPRMARHVMEMTYRIIRENRLTTVMITHQLQDALTYCDRLIIMHRGEIYKALSKSEMSQMEPADLFVILEEMVAI